MLSLPTDDGPHPAIVLVTGSVSPSTGLLDGASSPGLAGYANDLVQSGYAVLRFDLVPDVGHNVDWTMPAHSDRLAAWLRSHDLS